MPRPYPKHSMALEAMLFAQSFTKVEAYPQSAIPGKRTSGCSPLVRWLVAIIV